MHTDDPHKELDRLVWEAYLERYGQSAKPDESFMEFAEPLYTALRFEEEHERLVRSNEAHSIRASLASRSFSSIDRKRAELAPLENRAFDDANPPVEPVPRLLVASVSAATPGNIATITAQAKVGKSALIGAAMTAIICAENQIDGVDTLGFTADAPNGRALIHLDTEQSRYDADQLVRRALKRAGVAKCPRWLKSYSLAGFEPAVLRRKLAALLEWYSDRRGLFAVIIDGVADMVLDVNDARECNGLVTELHNLAIRFDCPVLVVVHENPGADSGKARGHLGSQLERKAESNLRLKKVDGATVVFSEKMRRAPIFEKDGPRFAWSDQAGMHVSIESAGEERDDAKRAELRELAAEVFEGRDRLKFTDMTAGIVKARDCTKRTAERKLDAMLKLKVIRKEGFGLYSPTTDNAPSNQPT